MIYEKTCKIHGILSKEHIISEPTIRAKRGYVLRCRLCRLEMQHRQYEKRRIVEDRKRNSMWASGERSCQIHGLLTEDNVIVFNSKKNKNGKQIRCKKCVTEQNWKSQFTRHLKNATEITRVRGISVAEYEKMFNDQKNVCKICSMPETRKSRTVGEICRLVVDHCHATLRVRGLLCHQCNLMIGYARDNISILDSAIRYVKEYDK